MSNALWERLAAAGLVQGDPPAIDEDATPWFVRVMLGIAGWFGAGFLLGFIGIALQAVMRNAGASVFVGALLCGGAVILNRRNAADFMTMFALAVSFTGQALILFGVVRILDDVGPISLAMAVVEAALFAATPNVLHRTWCAAAGAFAVTLALGAWQAYAVAPGVLAAGYAFAWWQESKQPTRRALTAPLAYGVALALAVTLGFLTQPLHGDPTVAKWFARGGPAVALAAAAISTAVLVFAALELLKREGKSANSNVGRAVIGGALALGLMSLGASGIGAATLLVVLAFAAGNRVLFGLGVLTLLAYLSRYYYALDLTLLQKSGVLFASGSVLLVFRVLMRAWFGQPPAEAAHA